MIFHASVKSDPSVFNKDFDSVARHGRIPIQGVDCRLGDVRVGVLTISSELNGEFVRNSSNSLSFRMTVAMKAELERTAKALTRALLGGVVFWTPSVVVHWIIAHRFSGFVVIGLTVLLPATTIFFFRMIS
jgi:hypothetical protein